MNLVALQKEVDRVSRELRVSGDLTDARLIEMKADLDQIKLEIAALSRFLEREIPSFARDFPEVREKILREVNPEVENSGNLIPGGT